MADIGHGRIEAGAHVFALRVYWEDTDAAGIVYYANYLKFIERGRTEMLRHAGVDQQAILEADGLAFAVRAVSVEYLRPAKLEDEIEVVTRVAELGGASLVLDQDVRRADAALAAAQVRIACIDRAGRPKRLPRALSDAIRHFAKA